MVARVLALDTLAMLGNVGSPLVTPDQPVKVSRQSVYGLVFATTLSTLAADVGRPIASWNGSSSTSDSWLAIRGG